MEIFEKGTLSCKYRAQQKRRLSRTLSHNVHVQISVLVSSHIVGEESYAQKGE